MITPETLATLRRRINPQYQDTIGTESYERKMLIDEIDRLRLHIIACLDDNAHLADGEDCTLIELKKAVPEWGEDDTEMV